MRSACLCLLLAALSPAASAATLERLSLEELALKSTAIVRAHASPGEAVRRGALIYTVTPLRVEERWKGDGGAGANVSLPGGRIGGVSQRFAGVPALRPGREYVLFLWTGPSGLTQVTGYSQGVFEVVRPSSGPPRVQRAADGGTFAAGSDGASPPAAEAMTLEALAARIQAALDRAAPAAEGAAGRAAAP